MWVGVGGWVGIGLGMCACAYVCLRVCWYKHVRMKQGIHSPLSQPVCKAHRPLRLPRYWVLGLSRCLATFA